MKKNKGITLIELLIAISISVILFTTIIYMWIESSSSLSKGHNNLTNLYDAGRIIANLRYDLDGANHIYPPYTKKDDEFESSIEFTAINEEISPEPFIIKWYLDKTKKRIIRKARGKTVDFALGKIDDFKIAVLLKPYSNRLKEATRVCVDVRVEMVPERNKKTKYSMSHVITPLNLNLILKSKYDFK